MTLVCSLFARCYSESVYISDLILTDIYEIHSIIMSTVQFKKLI